MDTYALEIKGKKHWAKLKNNNGTISVVFPVDCYPHLKSRKVMSLKLPADDPKNWAIADETLRVINLDIRNNNFDSSLERYKPQLATKSYKAKAESQFPTMGLWDLWEKYLDYKRAIVKPTTFDQYQTGITPLIRKISGAGLNLTDALGIRSFLIAHTTESYTKRVLQQINAAFKFGLKHKLISGSNPFEGLASEFKHPYEKNSPHANAFTLEEESQVLAAFGKFNGGHYLSFVRFLFLSGFRFNEAVGLSWTDINEDFSKILVNGGFYQSTKGNLISTKGRGDKNNKIRAFPLNLEASELLKSIKNNQDSELIFLSPEGHAIHYNLFSKIWHKVVDPIKPKTTPNCCRDTFFTKNVASGIPLAKLAKWGGNSASIIESTYYDEESDRTLPV